MRLINTRTHQFEEHNDPARIRYAILSHVWRKQEVLHSDYRRGNYKDKFGYAKLKNFCETARSERYDLVWMDTVFIDKISSAELTEAINSMYAWYQKAQVCFVYLDDVDDIDDIANCTWITRGWTLQELIAPRFVQFYNTNWRLLGTKYKLSGQLSTCTGIDQVVLEETTNVQKLSFATRMSWAAQRKTTRLEDRAYCLMGLFGVNMPLLYGEGLRAFYRLQEEILRSSTSDQSILCFGHELYELYYNRQSHSFLASEPSAFKGMRIVNTPQPSVRRLELTSAGLKITLQIIRRGMSNSEHRWWGDSECRWWGVLNCRYEGDLEGKIAIPLILLEQGGGSSWHIAENTSKMVIKSAMISDTIYQDIIISDSYRAHLAGMFVRSFCSIRFKNRSGLKVKLTHSSINGSWNPKTMTSEILHDNNIRLLQTFLFKDDKQDVSFLLRFVDATMTPLLKVRYPEISGHDLAYISCTVKPGGTDINSWLDQEMLHDHEHFIGLNWLSKGVNKSPYRKWKAEDARFQYDIDIPVGQGIMKVYFEIHAEASDMSTEAVWKIDVDTELRSASKRKRDN